MTFALVRSSSSTAWIRVSGRFMGGTPRSCFDNLGLGFDDVEHLVLEHHADEHLAFLCFPVLRPELREVLARLFGEFFEPFFELGVANLDVLGLGDLCHEKAGPNLQLAVGPNARSELWRNRA